MRKAAVLVLLALCFIAPSAYAFTFPVYAQDDFRLTFGVFGSPGAAGGNLHSDGQILSGGNEVLNFFTVNGSNPVAAYLNGSEYWTDYDVTVQMSTDPLGAGTMLWTGTGTMRTKVKVSGLSYPSAGYFSPANPAGTAPEAYQSMGVGEFLGAAVGPGLGNEWSAITKLAMPWFGTYNWRYDGLTVATSTYQSGNLQGMMTEIPEPGTLLLLGAVLAVFGVAKGRKRV